MQAGIAAGLDDSDKSPGWKFSEQEMRGIPVRVELGPKDIEAGKCVLVRRDTREKTECAIEDVAQTVKELLETIQREMFERAKAHRDSHISDAHDYAEFKRAVENKPVCRLKIRSISQIPVSAVENRHTNWYTGEKHIKICNAMQ